MLCYDYSVVDGVTYDDWYLPALNELKDYLYPQKDAVGGFSDNIYWSSSEGNANTAAAVGFGNGATWQYIKSANIYVRAIRQF
ncbi:MAG: hypothetical protein KAX05_07185 [Bacteroidales bacterium]|nr:hypothetical protein [Bacteroidales bacterium]